MPSLALAYSILCVRVPSLVAARQCLSPFTLVLPGLYRGQYTPILPALYRGQPTPPLVLQLPIAKRVCKIPRALSPGIGCDDEQEIAMNAGDGFGNGTGIRKAPWILGAAAGKQINNCRCKNSNEKLGKKKSPDCLLRSVVVRRVFLVGLRGLPGFFSGRLRNVLQTQCL